MVAVTVLMTSQATSPQCHIREVSNFSTQLRAGAPFDGLEDQFRGGCGIRIRCPHSMRFEMTVMPWQGPEWNLPGPCLRHQCCPKTVRFGRTEWVNLASF